MYAKPCIQPRPGTDQVIGDEDCLAVNVFTPELPTGTEGKNYISYIPKYTNWCLSNLITNSLNLGIEYQIRL